MVPKHECVHAATMLTGFHDEPSEPSLTASFCHTLGPSRSFRHYGHLFIPQYIRTNKVLHFA